MFERDVDDMDVQHVLVHGVVIEAYPEDKPCPSKLILGWVNNRPLHVVIANAMDVDIVVTVYEPDPQRWERGFKLRRTI